MQTTAGILASAGSEFTAELTEAQITLNYGSMGPTVSDKCFSPAALHNAKSRIEPHAAHAAFAQTVYLPYKHESVFENHARASRVDDSSA